MTGLELRNTGGELIDNAVGPLLIIVKGTTHLSPNDFNSVSGILLNRSNTRLGVGNVDVDLHQSIRVSLYHANRLLKLQTDRASAILIHTVDALVKFDQSLVDRRCHPLKAVLNCFMIGDSSLTGDVTHMLLVSALAPQFRLDVIPHIADLTLESFRNIRNTVAEDFEVGLSTSDTLRDRKNIGGDAREGLRTEGILDGRPRGAGPGEPPAIIVGRGAANEVVQCNAWTTQLCQQECWPAGRPESATVPDDAMVNLVKRLMFRGPSRKQRSILPLLSVIITSNRRRLIMNRECPYIPTTMQVGSFPLASSRSIWIQWIERGNSCGPTPVMTEARCFFRLRWLRLTWVRRRLL